MSEQLKLGRKAPRDGQRVADLVSRFSRLKRFSPERTYGDVFAEKITELCGDEVRLDSTEKLLVAMKRHKIIDGRRLVTLLARHHEEARSLRQPATKSASLSKRRSV